MHACNLPPHPLAHICSNPPPNTYQTFHSSTATNIARIWRKRLAHENQTRSCFVASIRRWWVGLREGSGVGVRLVANALVKAIASESGFGKIDVEVSAVEEDVREEEGEFELEGWREGRRLRIRWLAKPVGEAPGWGFVVFVEDET